MGVIHKVRLLDGRGCHQKWTWTNRDVGGFSIKRTFTLLRNHINVSAEPMKLVQRTDALRCPSLPTAGKNGPKNASQKRPWNSALFKKKRSLDVPEILDDWVWSVFSSGLCCFRYKACSSWFCGKVERLCFLESIRMIYFAVEMKVFFTFQILQFSIYLD